MTLTEQNQLVTELTMFGTPTPSDQQVDRWWREPSSGDTGDTKKRVFCDNGSLQ